MTGTAFAIDLRAVDWSILVIYFIFVLGIGFVLKGTVKTSADFFLAGRKFMVGYELLAGPQRDITAEQAAARLREVL